MLHRFRTLKSENILKFHCFLTVLAFLPDQANRLYRQDIIYFVLANQPTVHSGEVSRGRRRMRMEINAKCKVLCVKYLHTLDKLNGLPYEGFLYNLCNVSYIYQNIYLKNCTGQPCL